MDEKEASLESLAVVPLLRQLSDSAREGLISPEQKLRVKRLLLTEGDVKTAQSLLAVAESERKQPALDSRQTQKRTRTWNTLSSDLLLLVYRFLEVDDVCELSVCCRDFSETFTRDARCRTMWRPLTTDILGNSVVMQELSAGFRGAHWRRYYRMALRLLESQRFQQHFDNSLSIIQPGLLQPHENIAKFGRPPATECFDLPAETWLSLPVFGVYTPRVPPKSTIGQAAMGRLLMVAIMGSDRGERMRARIAIFDVSRHCAKPKLLHKFLPSPPFRTSSEQRMQVSFTSSLVAIKTTGGMSLAVFSLFDGENVQQESKTNTQPETKTDTTTEKPAEREITILIGPPSAALPPKPPFFERPPVDEKDKQNALAVFDAPSSIVHFTLVDVPSKNETRLVAVCSTGVVRIWPLTAAAIIEKKSISAFDDKPVHTSSYPFFLHVLNANEQSKGVFLLRVVKANFNLVDVFTGKVSKDFCPHPLFVPATFAALFCEDSGRLLLVSGHEDGSVIAFWPLLQPKTWRYIVRPSADYSAQTPVCNNIAHLQHRRVGDAHSGNFLFFAQVPHQSSATRLKPSVPVIRCVDLDSPSLTLTSPFQWSGFVENPAVSSHLSCHALDDFFACDRYLLASAGHLWSWCDLSTRILDFNCGSGSLYMHDGRVFCVGAHRVVVFDLFANPLRRSALTFPLHPPDKQFPLAVGDFVVVDREQLRQRAPNITATVSLYGQDVAWISEVKGDDMLVALVQSKEWNSNIGFEASRMPQTIWLSANCAWLSRPPPDSDVKSPSAAAAGARQVDVGFQTMLRVRFSNTEEDQTVLQMIENERTSLSAGFYARSYTYKQLLNAVSWDYNRMQPKPLHFDMNAVVLRVYRGEALVGPSADTNESQRLMFDILTSRTRERCGSMVGCWMWRDSLPTREEFKQITTSQRPLLYTLRDLQRHLDAQAKQSAYEQALRDKENDKDKDRESLKERKAKRDVESAKQAKKEKEDERKRSQGLMFKRFYRGGEWVPFAPCTHVRWCSCPPEAKNARA